VVPRDEVGIHADVAVGIPPDDVVAWCKHEATDFAISDGDEDFCLRGGNAVAGSVPTAVAIRQ